MRGWKGILEGDSGKEKGAPEDRRAKGEKGVEEEDQRLLMASLT